MPQLATPGARSALLGTLNIPVWVPRTDTGQAAIWAVDFRQGPSSGLFWYNGKSYATFDLWRAAQSGTFTRSATGADAGWLDSASHLWSQSSADTLRAPHYAEDGAALGAVFDGSVQSILLRARDFTNASWTKSNCTVTRSAGLDGVANSGSRLTFTADGGYVTQALSTSASPRQPATWMKRVSGSGPINFSSDGGVTPTDFSGQLSTSFHKRCALAATSSATPEIRISGNAGDVIDIDGAGLAGPLLTTPIMAGSVALSRNLDALAIPVSAFTEGTLIVEGRTAPGLTTNNAIFASLDNGTTGTSVSIARGTSGKLQCSAVISNANQGLNDFGAYADSTDFKIAYAIKAGAFRGSLNGASFVDSVTQLSLPTITGFRAGIASFGAFGSIKTMALLPKAVATGYLPYLSQNTSNPLNAAGDSYISGASGVSLPVSLFALNGRPVNNVAGGGVTIDAILAQVQAVPATLRSRTWIIWDGSDNGYTAYDGAWTGYYAFYPQIAAAIGHNRFYFFPPGKRANMSSQENTDTQTIRQAILSNFPGNSFDWQTLLPDPLQAGDTQDGTHLIKANMDIVATPFAAQLVTDGR